MIRTLSLAIAPMLLMSQPALACPGPQYQEHTYPVCDIPLPAEGQTAYILEHIGSPTFADHYISAEDQPTAIAELQVDGTRGKIYVMIDSYEQSIWRFAGDTDAIERLVVVGDVTMTGVIGVPADRIIFALAQPTRPKVISSCTRVFELCSFRQWFSNTRWEPWHAANKADLEATAVRVVDEPALKKMQLSQGRPLRLSFVQPPAPDLIEKIDPASVVSAVPLKPYRQSPPRR
ncbi:MAG: hypothetical protein ACK5JT_19315 [Hyphomicrobiaceae bacterium]